MPDTPFDTLDQETRASLVDKMVERGDGRPPYYTTTEAEAIVALRAMTEAELRCWLREEVPDGG